MDSITPLQALGRAVEVAGSQSELGRLLGVRQQSVYEWLRHGQVPAQRALSIERATCGRVTRHQLRPDLYPPADVPDGSQSGDPQSAEEVTEATG